MAFRSFRVLTGVGGAAVPLAVAPLKMRFVVFSALPSNANRVAVGDEGASAALNTDQGIILNSTTPPVSLGNQEPIDLSGVYVASFNGSEGVAVAGDVVA